MLFYQQVRHLRRFQERTIRAMYVRGRSFDRIKESQSRRSDMVEWNYRSEIFAFSRRLQENISEDTLRRIFTHPSYVQKFKQNQIQFNLPELNIVSNEEMVHKGKELLDVCVKPYLRHILSRVPEDGISHITKHITSDDVLAHTAQWTGCKEIILSTDYPPSKSTMADTIRALVSGVEADFDRDRARRFVVDIIISYLNDKDLLDDIWVIPNPKETLNLILNNSSLPAYEPRIMFQTGYKTLEPCHIVGLYVNQKFLGSSAGETLEIAEHCAALDALKRLFHLENIKFVYGQNSEAIDYEAHKNEHRYIKDWSIDLK